MKSLPQNSDLPVQDKDLEHNPLYPVFLKLHNLHTVLIGAGNVGLEKLNSVLNNSPEAKITVIALDILPAVHTMASIYPGVRILQKYFTDTDLDTADIVIAATNDSELNRFVQQAAHDRKLLINVADKPELCDFYLGAIVQKGDLKIAISTNGKSPTIAKRIKEVLNENLPPELNISLRQIAKLRDTLSGDFNYKVRKLNEATSVLVEPGVASAEKKFPVILVIALLFIFGLVVALWYKQLI